MEDVAEIGEVHIFGRVFDVDVHNRCGGEGGHSIQHCSPYAVIADALNHASDVSVSAARSARPPLPLGGRVQRGRAAENGAGDGSFIDGRDEDSNGSEVIEQLLSGYRALLAGFPTLRRLLAILIREMKRTDAVVACPLNGNRVGRTDITGLGERVNL